MGSVGIQGKRKAGESDIAALRDLFAGSSADVVAPTDPGYQESCYAWSKAAEKPSGVTIIPRTAEDVAIAVKFAHDRSIDLAVRGGGHSTSGASSTDGGLRINLGKMRNTQVDPETKTIRAQGGCLWMDVDNAAWEHGLAVTGGTVSDTGIGGLILGGGIGWLTGKCGMTIDNLLECTVVTCEGEILEASESENSDLFWGLCGAGQNFGVVTEFLLQLHPQKEVLLGALMYPPTREYIEKTVAVCNKLFTPFDDGKGGLTYKAGAHASGGIAIMKPPMEIPFPCLLGVALFWDGPEAEGREMFKEFLDIGPINGELAMMPYPKANSLIQIPQNIRCSIKGAIFQMPLRSEFVQDLKDKFERDYIERFGDEEIGGSQFVLEFSHNAKIVASHKGCYANRGWHQNISLGPVWRSAQNDTACRQWARDMERRCEEELVRGGKYVHQNPDGSVSLQGEGGSVMMYGNYEQYAKKPDEIYGFNYSKLQALKAKWDPDGTFNKLFGIDPA